MDVERVVERDKEALGRRKARMERMAKANSLGLPKLLEKRRWECLIPDGAFAAQPVFERIFIYQIPEASETTYGSGILVKPELVGKRELQSSPRGVLVGAGLKALDIIRSNGMDLGHVVRFTHLAPFALMVDEAAGDQGWVKVMNVSYLVSSEDLMQAQRSGETVLEYDGEKIEHYYKPKGRKAVRPLPAEDGADE